MSFSVAELIAAIRLRLDDCGGDRPPTSGGLPAWQADDRPCLWRNAELIEHLRQTALDLGARRPILDDRLTIYLVPNLRLYRLPDYVLMVRSATRGSDAKPVLKTNRVELDHLDRAYRMVADGVDLGESGALRSAERVSHFLLDERSAHVAFWPTPTVADQIFFAVARNYRIESSWTLSDSLPDEVETSVLMRDALVTGACARAYKKRDSYAGDPSLVQNLEAEFNRLVGSPQSLTGLQARLRWGERQPRMIPKARFV